MPSVGSIGRRRFEQRALAAAVRADEDDLLAALDVEVHVEQHEVVAVGVATRFTVRTSSSVRP